MRLRNLISTLDGLQVFSFSDRAGQEALGFWREQID